MVGVGSEHVLALCTSLCQRSKASRASRCDKGLRVQHLDEADGHDSEEESPLLARNHNVARSGMSRSSSTTIIDWRKRTGGVASIASRLEEVGEQGKPSRKKQRHERRWSYQQFCKASVQSASPMAHGGCLRGNENRLSTIPDLAPPAQTSSSANHVSNGSSSGDVFSDADLVRYVARRLENETILLCRRKCPAAERHLNGTQSSR